jgi:hypothetical protein
MGCRMTFSSCHFFKIWFFCIVKYNIFNLYTQLNLYLHLRVKILLSSVNGEVGGGRGGGGRSAQKCMYRNDDDTLILGQKLFSCFIYLAVLKILNEAFPRIILSGISDFISFCRVFMLIIDE